ncbi:S-layer homology domain-containing protein [Ureibacillus composti]
MNKLTKTLSAVGLASAVLFSSMGVASASEVHYKDVNKDDNFYKSVDFLLEQNAISNTLPTFRPYENITRGQFASIFAKVLGLDVTNVKNANFKDVPVYHQFYPYVSALENEGIIGGYSNGNFGINDRLTRGQMAGILIKAYGIEKIDDLDYGAEKNILGTDIDIRFFNDIFNGYGFRGGQWDDELGTLELLGIMSGYADNNMYPNKPINRSQFANMIYKIKQKGVADYFYAYDHDIIHKDLFTLIMPNADKYLDEFLDEKDNGLVNFVKSASERWDDSINPMYVNRYTLRPIKEGEYVVKDGKAKFVLKKVNGEWQLTLQKIETPVPVSEEPKTTKIQLQ